MYYGVDRFVILLGLLKSPGYNYFTQNGSFFRFFTYSVLHASFLHYALNMLNFWLIYKVLLKYKTNNTLIELVYILSITIGGLAQLHFSSRPELSIIGASGGVFGLYGMMLAHYFIKKDWSSFLISIFIDGFFNVFLVLQVPNIGWIAHLAGVIIGFSFGLLFIPSKKIKKIYHGK